MIVEFVIRCGNRNTPMGKTPDSECRRRSKR
jgi:hypothetical protein